MEKSTKVILGILFLVIIILVIFGAYYLTKERVGFFGRAGGKVESYSLDNSYLFASPVVSQAGGEQIKISVFLLSPEGKGVPGKKIDLVSQPPLTIAEVQPETDDKGQAIFEISAPTAGRYIIQAAVEGNVFPQSVTVTFN